MASNLSSTFFEDLLNFTFRGTGATHAGPPSRITSFVVFSGPLPPNLGSVGIIARSATIPIAENTWLAQTNGVTMLSNPLSFTASSSADLTFVRFLDNLSNPVIDLELATAPSAGFGKMTSLTVVAGQTYTIDDVRFSLGETSGVSFGQGVRNYFLGHLTNGSSAFNTPSGYLGAFSSVNVEGGAPNPADIVTVRAYTGSVPANADSPATGTLILSTPLTVTQELVTVAGTGFALNLPVADNALANGTPTYIRVTKPATASAPSIAFQATVGNGVILSPPTATSGQPLVLSALAVRL